MGGGAFADKIVPVLAPAKPPAEVAEALKAGVADADGWRAVYAYKASDDVFVVGLTNAKTEGRAFGIAGEKRATEANPFPGLDHAAAFPIEVVVTKKGAGSSVTLLKEMWRMKLYFQDAGNWAFMKNMQMPGDIQNEIEAAVQQGGALTLAAAAQLGRRLEQALEKRFWRRARAALVARDARKRLLDVPAATGKRRLPAPGTRHSMTHGGA